MRRWLALWTILAVVSVAASFLLSPGLSARQVPELTPDDLGKPYPAKSLSGFKASRDFDVLDEAHTQARRDEARAGVRPVFDYDPNVEPRVKHAVREAFLVMQEAVVSHLKAKGAPADALAPRRGPAKEDAELASLLKDERRRFETHLTAPDDEDFDALALGRFSPELEQAVVALVELAYRARIVASRDELSRIDANGITVRLVGGSTEYDMATQAPAVMDLREAQTELDRWASVPGNLLPESSALTRRAVLRLAKRQVRANLTVNIAETEARRKAAYEAVKPAVISIKKGQRIIGDGELVTETHLLMVRSLRSQLSQLDLLQVQVGGAGLVALLVGGVWAFFQAALRRFRPNKRDALFMGLVAMSLLGLLHSWMLLGDLIHDRSPLLPIEAFQYGFPVAAGAMLVRFVLSEESALYFAVVFSSLAGILLGSSLGFMLFAFVTSLVAAWTVARAKDRAGILQAGAVTGTVGLFLVVFSSLAAGKGLAPETWMGGLFALASAAVAAPMLVLTLTPVVEAVFGYASDLKLLELANLNHPALKELVLQAPGTYHHSIIMGSLVEAAAEAIRANPLLARSCAYYHDIGKGRNPAYFGENQKGENAHDQLAPAMSAMIIKRHVSEGLEMARQYKLPRRVADAIPQHHGTRAVGYFLHKAQKELEGRPEAPPLDEAAYHYPGPKPQFREAALVMIADAVEAASRSMPDPTEEKLTALVQKLINLVFSEGQLDDCDLTLRDLHLITQSFVRTLEGIYHVRPAYPAGAVGGGKAPVNEVVKPLAVVGPGRVAK